MASATTTLGNSAGFGQSGWNEDCAEEMNLGGVGQCLAEREPAVCPVAKKVKIIPACISSSESSLCSQY